MARASSEARSAAASRAAFVALLAFAAALRWWEWSRAVTLFNDGPEFLALARAAAVGDFGAVLAHPYHPLYPMLVAAIHALGIGWESAAVGIGVVGGTAAVGFLFLFLRDAFGAPAAWIGAGLLAVHSRAVEYSSDIQSDGLYLGLFLAGVWFGWRAWTRRSTRDAAAAGLAAGLAYLTRPEGLGLAFVLAAIAVLEALRGRWRPVLALRWTAAIAATLAVCVLPYVVALERQSGEWTLTRKKTVSQLTGAPPSVAYVAAGSPHGRSRAVASPLYAPVPASVAAQRAELDRGEDGLAVLKADTRVQRAVAAARMLFRTGKSAFRYGPLILLVFGLVAARGRPSARALYIGAIAGAYAVVLYALTFFLGYVSRRHALPPLLPLFGYAGLGALALGSFVSRIAERREIAWLTRLSPVAIAAAIAVSLGIGELATQVRPRREEERAARTAAEWLRDNAEPAPIATTRLRLGYYAGMPYVPLVRVDDASLASQRAGYLHDYLTEAGARYVLVEDAAEAEAIQRALGPRVRTLHSVREGGSEAWVFECVAATAGTPP